MIALRYLCRLCTHAHRNPVAQKSTASLLLFSRSFGQCFVLVNSNTNGIVQNNVSFRILQNSLVCAGMMKREASKSPKGKGKGKGKGGGKTKLDLSLGYDVIDLGEVQRKMANSTRMLTDTYRDKFAANLTANVLDKIGVEVDGSRWRVNEIADITSRGKEFVITCSSASHGKEIGKAIQKSLNIPVSFEDTIVRVPMLLSTEYRRDLVKPVKEAADKTLRDVRDIQQNAAKKLKKSSESKDAIKLIEEQVQLLFDMHNAQTKEVLSKKLDELQS